MEFNPMIPDALALEYKRDYGCATGEIELSDLVNYPPLASEFRRLGLSLPEEFLRLVLGDVRAVGDDVPDTLLISTKSI